MADAAHPFGPFSIPEIRDIIPEKVKPFIIILFLIFIQLSGGVYLASSSEMVGCTALLQEDIQMAGIASLIGMALDFVYMFRIKCAIPPKTTFFLCGIIIIIANIICMYTTSVPVLVTTCFIAGFFRMQVTFQCNSTIQLWLTPTRDLSVFFCWIYFIVNGTINLSGILSVYLTSLAEWQMMQWCIIGMMIVMLIMVQLLFRNYSTMPKIPFKGIDYLGMLLWGVSAMSVLFICIYGEHYDWWHSEYIWAATFSTIICIGLACWRSSFIRHPYIWLSTFKEPIIWLAPLTIIAMDTLLAPEKIFEHALMENILGYDSLNLISLNWIGFLATPIAVVFTWRTFSLRKWRYRTMLLIGFSCIAIYLAYFYFMIDYNISKETLMFPVFIRNFGYVILSITILTANTRLAFPFKFFQGVTIQNVFSAALGSAIGTAIVGRLLKIIMTKNTMLIGASLDHVNLQANHIPLNQLYGIVQQHSLLVSMKEIYGYLLMICLFILFIILIRREHMTRPIQVIQPKFSTIRKQIKHYLRMESNDVTAND